MDSNKMNLEMDDNDDSSYLFPENWKIEKIKKVINVDRIDNQDSLFYTNDNIFNDQYDKSFSNLFLDKKINFYEKIKSISLQNYDNNINEILKDIKNKFDNGYLNKELIDNYIFMNYNKSMNEINIFNSIHTKYNKLLINLKNSLLSNNFTSDLFIKDILNFTKNFIDTLIKDIMNYDNQKIKNDLIKFNETKSFLSKNSLETVKFQKKKWTEEEIKIIKKLILKDNYIDTNDITNFCNNFKRSKNSVLSKINKLKKQIKSEKENINKYLPNNIIYQLIDLKFGNDEYLSDQGLFFSSIKNILNFQNIKFEENQVIKQIELWDQNKIYKIKKVDQFKISDDYNFKPIYHEEISIKDYIYDLFKNNNNFLYFEIILNKIKINFQYQHHDLSDELLNFWKNDKNIIYFQDLFIFK